MKKYLKLSGIILVYIVATLAIIFPLRSLYINKIITLPGDGFYKSLYMFFTVNYLLQLVAIYLVVRYVRKKNLIKMSNFSKPENTPLIIACITGIFMGIFTESLLRSSYFIENCSEFVGLMDYIMFHSGNLYMFLIFLVVACFFREVLFRGVLFNEIRMVLPVSVAIIMQALLYSASFFTLDIATISIGFFESIIFVLFYIYGKSIWVSLTVQITSVLSLYILKRIGSSIINYDTIPMLLIATLIVIIALSIYVVKSGINNSAKQPIA
jgi:uncharacterized protein